MKKPLAVLAAAACAAGLASIAPVSAASAAGTADVVAACATPTLVIWAMPALGGATAGSFYYDVNFTNLSGHACALAGYPGVSAVTFGGHQLGSAAGRNPAHTAVAVTLSQGATATALLQVTDVGVFGPGQCHPTMAAGLRVYPPNQTMAKVAPVPLNACAAPGLTYLHVETVQVQR